MLSSGIPWNMPRITCIFCIHTKIQAACSTVSYDKACIKQKQQNREGENPAIAFVHVRVLPRVLPVEDCPLHTAEYAMAFLASDWLYFLWYGILLAVQIADNANVTPVLVMWPSKIIH